MTELKVGDRVLYYRRLTKSWSRSPKKFEAEVLKVGKQRVTIRLPDGTRKSVEPENLEKQSAAGAERKTV